MHTEILSNDRLSFIETVVIGTLIVPLGFEIRKEMVPMASTASGFVKTTFKLAQTESDATAESFQSNSPVRNGSYLIRKILSMAGNRICIKVDNQMTKTNYCVLLFGQNQ